MVFVGLAPVSAAPQPSARTVESAHTLHGSDHNVRAPCRKHCMSDCRRVIDAADFGAGAMDDVSWFACRVHCLTSVSELWALVQPRPLARVLPIRLQVMLYVSDSFCMCVRVVFAGATELQPLAWPQLQGRVMSIMS